MLARAIASNNCRCIVQVKVLSTQSTKGTISERCQPLPPRRLFASSPDCRPGLWRSFFYVPGDKGQMIAKAATLHTREETASDANLLPDVIVLDCEDGVGADRKHEARSCIASSLALPNGGQFAHFRERLSRLLVVRINSLDDQATAETDIESLIDATASSVELSQGRWPGPDFLCLPKVESIDQLKWLGDRIQKWRLRLFPDTSKISPPQIGMVAMIESCRSLVNLPALCETSQSAGLPLQTIVLGSDDYCVSLGVERTKANVELGFPRQYLPVVARAFNLVSIDMVDIDYKDTDNLKANSLLGAQLGFSGKQVIHPAQLPIVNQSYSPNPSRVSWARELLASASSSSDPSQAVRAGAFAFRGRMIDRPTLRQAEQLVKNADLLAGASSSPIDKE